MSAVASEGPKLEKRGFLPVAEPDAAVLILGTLPGDASLQLQQYYGQRRNAFWRIMGELFGAGPELPYEERLRKLTSARLALWDVCHAATRPGSLDASIEHGSVKANDFAAFFELHPRIRLVCFNGSKAEKLFRDKVSPTLDEHRGAIRYEQLPSTSPAHAAMPYADKVKRWSIVKLTAPL
jgi:hypoxanthine-DNA glycosylase